MPKFGELTILNEQKNILENVLKAATGDFFAAKDVFIAILNSPVMIRERLFWDKFSLYLKGVFMEDEDVRKLSATFAEKEELEEYARKIIKCVDDIDSNIKVKYIVNLTRALLARFITKPDYYRCLNVIRNTLEDDLTYLKNNVMRNHLKYNIHIEFLKQNSLVVQTVISGDDMGEFEFTELAHMLDKYGLDYENDEKYKYSSDSHKDLSSYINSNVIIKVDGGDF